MRKFLLVLVAVLLTSCGSAFPQYTRTPDEVSFINSATIALVKYSDLDGEYAITCTGAFVDFNVVLTAAHCVDADELIYRVALFNDWRFGDKSDPDYGYEFLLVNMDTQNDIAMLVSGESLPPHESLRLADVAPSTGENVIIVGHPAGSGWTLTSGVVSYGYRRGDAFSEDSLWLQSDAGMFYGNSGGPIMNHENDLVGIVSHGLPYTHLGKGVHLDVIRDFYRSSK